MSVEQTILKEVEDSKMWYDREKDDDHKRELASKNKSISNIDALHYFKGSSLAVLRQYEHALDSFDRALEINPKNDHYLYSKGVMLELLEKFEEAVSYYDKVLAINPNYSDASTRKQNVVNFLSSSGGRHYNSDGKVV